MCDYRSRIISQTVECCPRRVEERGRERSSIYGERRIYMCFFFLPKIYPLHPEKPAICKRNNASNGPCLRYTIDKYPGIPERKSCTLHGDKTKGNQTKERQEHNLPALRQELSAVTPKNYGYIILNGFTCIKAIVNIYIRYTL